VRPFINGIDPIQIITESTALICSNDPKTIEAKLAAVSHVLRQEAQRRAITPKCLRGFASLRIS